MILGPVAEAERPYYLAEVASFDRVSERFYPSIIMIHEALILCLEGTNRVYFLSVLLIQVTSISTYPT